MEYNEDFTSRSVVDFENGTVTVDVLMDENEVKDQQKVNQKLATAVEKTLSSRASTNPYRGTVDETKPLTQKPVLDGLVDVASLEKKPSQPTAVQPAGAVYFIYKKRTRGGHVFYWYYILSGQLSISGRYFRISRNRGRCWCYQVDRHGQNITVIREVHNIFNIVHLNPCNN